MLVAEATLRTRSEKLKHLVGGVVHALSSKF